MPHPWSPEEKLLYLGLFCCGVLWENVIYLKESGSKKIRWFWFHRGVLTVVPPFDTFLHWLKVPLWRYFINNFNIGSTNFCLIQLSGYANVLYWNMGIYLCAVTHLHFLFALLWFRVAFIHLHLSPNPWITANRSRINNTDWLKAGTFNRSSSPFEPNSSLFFVPVALVMKWI